MEQEERQTLWKTLVPRYFAQGFLFSLIFLGLAIVLVFVLAVLIMIGYIIGLTIGFLIILYIIGGLNATLTGWIWHVSIRMNWKALLIHGLILFIALITVHIPAFVVNLAKPGLATTLVLFIVYCFIDGFIARGVAGYYEKTPECMDETT